MTTVRQQRARAVADLAGGAIVARVEIAASPERVFRALASKDVVEWWGAEGVYHTKEWSGDVRVGGRWRASGVGADGKPFAVGGEYLEVDPPRALVHTWEADWEPGKTTRVAIRLEPIDGGTRVTLRHEGFESRESCEQHGDGWAMVLDWLASHVAPARKRAFFVIRLLPPRATFLADMTDGERRIMHAHVGYWAGLLRDGVAIAFGPVGDPKGPWGLGVVEVESAEETKKLEAGDPAIAANVGFRYEVLPMLNAFVRPL